MENITPGEVLDELWGIFFLILKAFLGMFRSRRSGLHGLGALLERMHGGILRRL